MNSAATLDRCLLFLQRPQVVAAKAQNVFDKLSVYSRRAEKLKANPKVSIARRHAAQRAHQNFRNKSIGGITELIVRLSDRLNGLVNRRHEITVVALRPKLPFPQSCEASFGQDIHDAE